MPVPMGSDRHDVGKSAAVEAFLIPSRLDTAAYALMCRPIEFPAPRAGYLGQTYRTSGTAASRGEPSGLHLAGPQRKVNPTSVYSFEFTVGSIE